jgi:hypothetical protein
MLNANAGRDRFDLPKRWQSEGARFSLLEPTKLEKETIVGCWIDVAMTVVAVWIPKTAAAWLRSADFRHRHFCIFPAELPLFIPVWSCEKYNPGSSSPLGHGSGRTPPS